MISRDELKRVVEQTLLLKIDEIVSDLSYELLESLEQALNAEKAREKKVQAAAAARQKSQERQGEY